MAADGATDPGNWDDIAPRGFAGELIEWKSRQMALQLGLCRADQDDIAQTLRLEALRRSRAFHADRGDWRAFIREVVERRCRTLVRKYLRKHRHALMDGTEMGSAVSQADNFRRVHRGAAMPTEQPELLIDIPAIVSRMSDQDRALCQDLSQDSISEAARRRGVARSTIQDHIGRLKKSFGSLNPTKKPPLTPEQRGY